MDSSFNVEFTNKSDLNFLLAALYVKARPLQPDLEGHVVTLAPLLYCPREGSTHRMFLNTQLSMPHNIYN